MPKKPLKKPSGPSSSASTPTAPAQSSSSLADLLCQYLIPILVAIGLSVFLLSFVGEEAPTELISNTTIDTTPSVEQTNTSHEPIVTFPDMSLTDKDLEQIAAMGSTQEEVERQLKNFRDGFGFTRISKPTIIGDGIERLDDQQLQEMQLLYDNVAPNLQTVKFVPASGAASRMFKALFSFMEELANENERESALKKLEEKSQPTDMAKFFSNLKKFAFYDDLNDAMSSVGGIETSLKERRHYDILRYLLTDIGLDYGSLPKGMLRFHAYPSKDSTVSVFRTPIEEHLVEGAQYCQRANKTVGVHFTVSPDHLEAFKLKVESVRGLYEARFGVRYQVEYSIQKPSTDTVAVTPENEPFRLDDGSLLFRPAGHGALIENINDLTADVVFIKNIDNVVPDYLKETTVSYKKALGGILLQAQQRIHNYYKLLQRDNDSPLSDERLDEILQFMAVEMGSTAPDSLTGSSRDKLIAYLMNKLLRPIRVCGMVPASGETGGGPFWATSMDGGSSIQIVETAQIDINDPTQSSVMSAATHFNPVDVVFSAKKPDGTRFDLTQFRDLSAGFISSKSLNGRDLKAQELPGLWNGAMADWNTIFIEVPLITFNPVKTVNDLLRSEHQPQQKKQQQ